MNVFRPRGLTIKRTDKNHAEILRAARAVGADVVDTHICGQGAPDAVVLYPAGERARAWLIEIKTADGELTDAEKRYALRSRTPVHVVRTVDELLKLIGAT